MTRLLLVSDVYANELIADEALATAFSTLPYITQCISGSPTYALNCLKEGHPGYDVVLFVLPAGKKVSDLMGQAIRAWDSHLASNYIGVITNHVQSGQWTSLSEAGITVMAMPHFDESGVAYFSTNLLNFIREACDDDES